MSYFVLQLYEMTLVRWPYYTTNLYRISICARYLGSTATRYVLPVSRLTSHLHTIDRMEMSCRCRCSE